MTDLPDDLRYAPSHEWARLEEDGLVAVGISDHAQQELGDIVFVELPEMGKKLTAGEEAAVVESVKAASDIYSPVSGEVTARNDEVLEAPEVINEDPYEAWLFKLRPTDPSELENLLDADGYAAHIGEPA